LIFQSFFSSKFSLGEHKSHENKKKKGIIPNCINEKHKKASFFETFFS